MEHHLIHRIGNLFPSPFTSCKSIILPDVAENSISIPQAFHNILQPFPNLDKNHSRKVSKNHSQPLDSKTKNSSSSNSGWFSTASDKDGDDQFHRKIDKCFNFSSCSSESFRRRFDCKIIDDLGRCPSAISSTQNCNLETTRKSTAVEKPTQSVSVVPTKKVYKKSNILKKELDFKEPLTELYYSSYRKDGPRKTKRSRKNSRRKRVPAVGSESKRHLIGGNDHNEGIKESIAVEKSSSDPYGDFRKSMVEMIVDKRIFGAKNLYKLLECFLSLNSPYYHTIILEVFIEICDTLFSN